MAKYKVNEVYTPEDTDLDRRRKEYTFSTDATDIFEIAVAARIAAHDTLSPELEANVRAAFRCDDVQDQLSSQEADAFDFILYSNNGEWETCVERIDEIAAPATGV
jgi:hypothetical protein